MKIAWLLIGSIFLTSCVSSPNIKGLSPGIADKKLYIKSKNKDGTTLVEYCEGETIGSIIHWMKSEDPSVKVKMGKNKSILVFLYAEKTKMRFQYKLSRDQKGRYSPDKQFEKKFSAKLDSLHKFAYQLGYLVFVGETCLEGAWKENKLTTESVE